MGALNVLPLRADDLDELSNLFQGVDHRFFAHASRAAAERFLGEPEDIHVVGRVDGRLVAFGMLRGWHEGYREPSLGIAVGRTDEGRGFGRAMMGALHQLAVDRGARSVRLRVHPDNVRAFRLYESVGYESIGEERGQILMRIRLDSPPRSALDT